MFEIIKTLKYKETVFIDTNNTRGTIRCVKANAVRYLISNFENFRFYDKHMNLYGSLSHYPNMPMFSYAHKERIQQREQFNKDALSLTERYDFLFDIDNTDIKQSYATTSAIKEIFDEKKIKMSLIFSGNKGFHIKIDYKDFPEWMRKMRIPDLIDKLKLFAERFQVINDFKDIDIRIFDNRRIAKTPYSVVYPYYFVALPLSDEDFENFSLEKVSLPYLYKRRNMIFNRGLLTRQGNPENFGELIKEYTEK